ncbi:hypothetical protein EDB86DRAFT_717223 [Lactarius hatsudake]|nr:hypothetical protein EDB86DRAFT_717223 [Lactarius hatsudake]
MGVQVLWRGLLPMFITFIFRFLTHPVVWYECRWNCTLFSEDQTQARRQGLKGTQLIGCMVHFCLRYMPTYKGESMRRMTNRRMASLSARPL